MKDEDYAYAVARIRANEKKLLTGGDIEALLKCKTLDEVVRFLQSREWIDKNEESFDIGKAVAYNQKRLWTLLTESVPCKDELFVFTVQNDFFNIKAALKCMLTSNSAKELFVFPTSLDLDMTVENMQKHNFSAFGSAFSSACKQAYEIACRTQNGQNAEIILDKAAIVYIEKLAENNSCALVRDIADFLCAAAVMKTAYRCAVTKRSLSFAQTAIAECKYFSSEVLARLSVEGEQALIEYLKKSQFSKGIELLSMNSAAFEKWCDDTVTEMTKRAKMMFFGFEPICAYYYAKQAEIKTVRIILGAKQSGFSDEAIRERVRALYV